MSDTNAWDGTILHDRRPVLLFSELKAIAEHLFENAYGPENLVWGALHSVSMAIESKITSGELRVAKTARMEKMQAKSYLDPYYKCSECGHEWMDYVPEVGEFCKCGAKIIE